MKPNHPRGFGQQGSGGRKVGIGAGSLSPGLASPPRKIVIQAIAPPKLPAAYEAETWGRLQESIAAIYGRRVVAESLESLYRGVETLCQYSLGSSLHSRLRSELDHHVSAEVSSLIGVPATDEAYLRVVSACWERHCGNAVLIRNVFMFLDRTYVLQNPGVQGVWDMALALFREHLTAQPEATSKTLHALLRLVERERRGDAVDRQLAATVAKMLSSVGLYEESFEPALLRETTDFYRREGVANMATAAAADVAEYLRKVDSRLKEEADRATTYLLARSKKQLLTIAETELFQAHLRAILDRGLDAMLERARADDLARLYALCARVDALGELRKSFLEHCKAAGRAIVSDAQRDKTMVQDLLELKAKLEAVVDGPFAHSQQFGNAVKEAFEVFVNERANKPAELIAKFVDKQLRPGNRTGSEEDLEALMDRVVAIFRMINGKDVFEAFYKKHLAKRLLHSKSASVDSERAMISKLKAECGSAFTLKLEGMFKDIENSKADNDKFREKFPPAGNTAAEVLNVSVLTSAYWPVYPNVELALPPELDAVQKSFHKFYTEAHGSRTLSFQNSLGTMVLRAAYPKGRKDLTMPLPLAIVLLAFNSADSMQFRDIQQRLAIDPKELKPLLQALSAGKFKLLTKSKEQQREVSEDETFAFNPKFASKLGKIKVSVSRPKEAAAAEDAKTQETVQVDRQYQIDAAIVRIMKTRKHLSHAQLIAELLGQLRFPVTPTDLKKRIESLIEREYLERNKDDAQAYDYLA